MEYPITKKFEDFESNITLCNIETKDLQKRFLDYSNKDKAAFFIKRYEDIGYIDVKEKYSDILNIESFRFVGTLEVDDYFSDIEINIGKVFSKLAIRDYDENLWFDGQPEEEKELWKTFRSFDTRPEIGDGKMAVFSIKEGVSPPAEPAIYYIDRAFYCKTNLTFVQYYEALLDMMGIADWQILFSEVSLKDPMISYKYDGLSKSLQALAKAFPDKDYTKYFKLLEDKWKNRN